MEYDDFTPRTVTGIKILAKKLKKRDGIRHAEALDAAARQGGWNSYADAREALEDQTVPAEQVLPGHAFADLLRDGEER